VVLFYIFEAILVLGFVLYCINVVGCGSVVGGSAVDSGRTWTKTLGVPN